MQPYKAIHDIKKIMEYRLNKRNPHLTTNNSHNLLF